MCPWQPYKGIDVDWKILTGDFGKSLLSYALNVDPAIIESWATNQTAPNQDQAKFLKELIEWRLNHDFSSPSPIGSEFHFQTALSRELIFPVNAFSKARKSFGGAFSINHSKDPLLALICELGADLFPLVLWRSRKRAFSESTFGVPLTESFFGHPKQTEMWDLFKRGPFKKLFSCNGKDEECFGLAFSSAGHGGGSQLILAHARIWQNAELLFMVRGHSDQQSFQDCIMESYQLLINVLSGKETWAPAFIGIDNIALDLSGKSSSFNIGNDNLFPAPSAFSQYLPPTHRSYSHHDGTRTFQTGLIFETKYKFVAKVGEQPLEACDELAEIGKTSIGKKLDHFRLAALLADTQPYKSLSECWRLLIDPLCGVSFSYRQARQQSNVFLIKDETATKLDESIKLLSAIDYTKAQIAIRRLILAVLERNDATDSFVDAVIAWENLFGGKTETVVRVCMSMTRLLEKDAKKRDTLHKELKEIYGARSDIVHGNKEIPIKDICVFRDKAISYGIQAFRILISERASLIQLPASKRGEAILLE